MIKITISDEYGNVLDVLEESEGDFDFTELDGEVLGHRDILSALKRAHRKDSESKEIQRNV